MPDFIKKIKSFPLFNKVFSLLDVKEKESREKEEISFDQINPWFDERAGSYYRRFDAERDGINNKINELIQNTKGLIEKLKNAELRNKDIPLREKQFMEGNRQAYIQRAELIIRSIRLPDNIEEINNFYSSFLSSLDDFKKSTLKPYQILQHFFEHESNNILYSIKKIEVLAKELDGITKNGKISRTSDIKSKVDEIKNKKKLKEELKNRIIEKEKEEKRMKTEIKEDEENLAKLKKSKEFSNYIKKTESFKKIKDRIKEKEDSIVAEFSVLEKAMKKFARMSFEDEDLINNYLGDPVKTLVSDNALKITDILKKLETGITMDKIELKDKKKEKSLKVIKKLNKEFFEGFLSDYNKSIGEKNSLIKEINESNVKQIFYQLENKVIKDKENLEKLNRNLEDMRKDIDKININDMVKGLEANLRQFSGEDVVII